MKPIAILTCDCADRTFDTEYISALSKKGYCAESVCWTQTTRPWTDFSSAIVCSTWDYYLNEETASLFLSTLRRICDSGVLLLNPFKTIEWNFKKTYLKQIAHAGVPTIETIWLSKSTLKYLPETIAQISGSDKFVIKPVLSAGGFHTKSFKRDQVLSIVDEYSAIDEVDQWMVQPFLSEVLEQGEYSFLFILDKLSHCVLKTPRPGNFITSHPSTTDIRQIQPTENQKSQVLKIMETVNEHFVSGNLYTRVDVIERNGVLVVMELEMIEPFLYPNYCDGFFSHYADAIITAIEKNSQ